MAPNPIKSNILAECIEILRVTPIPEQLWKRGLGRVCVRRIQQGRLQSALLALTFGGENYNLNIIIVIA